MRWTCIRNDVSESRVLFDDFVDEFSDEVIGDFVFMFFDLVELIVCLFFCSKAFYLFDD